MDIGQSIMKFVINLKYSKWGRWNVFWENNFIVGIIVPQGIRWILQHNVMWKTFKPRCWHTLIRFVNGIDGM
jgi:hypothetical protein